MINKIHDCESGQLDVIKTKLPSCFTQTQHEVLLRIFTRIFTIIMFKYFHSVNNIVDLALSFCDIKMPLLDAIVIICAIVQLRIPNSTTLCRNFTAIIFALTLVADVSKMNHVFFRLDFDTKKWKTAVKTYSWDDVESFVCFRYEVPHGVFSTNHINSQYAVNFQIRFHTCRWL